MARRAQVSVGNRLLERALKQYGDDIIDRVQEIVVETTMMIYNNVISLMPEDDGNLRQSTEFEISEDGLSGRVTIGAHYAIYVNYGTGIHAVNGDGRKTPWVYWSDKLGRFVYTVGQQPQEFWGPSIDRASRYFSREIKRLG